MKWIPAQSDYYFKAGQHYIIFCEQYSDDNAVIDTQIHSVAFEDDCELCLLETKLPENYIITHYMNIKPPKGK